MARTTQPASHPTPGRAGRHGRVSATVLDQIFSSGTQFLVAILIANVSSADVLGAAGAVLLVQGLIIGVQRALIGDIVLLRCRRDGASATDEARTGLFLTLALAAGIALLLVAAAAVFDGVTRSLLLVLAATTPITFGQDLCRSVAYGRRRVGDAVILDGVWFVVQIMVSASLLATDRATATTLLAAWGVGAGVSLVAGFWRGAQPPSPRGVKAWVSDDGRRAASFVADYGLNTGAVLLSHLTLASVLPIAEFGALRLALMSVTPPTNLLAGFRSLMLGRLGENHDAPRPMRIFAGRVAVAFAALTGFYGAALVVTPVRFGELAFGEVWGDARPLVAAVALGELFRFASVPAIDLVRIFGTASALVRTRMVTSAASVLAILLGGLLFGTGLVWVTAAVWTLASALWWWQAVRATDQRSRSRR